MTMYERLLSLGKAQLKTTENGEEFICFYPHLLKEAIENTKLIDKKIELQIMSAIGRYFDESSIYPMELYSRIMAILRGDT